jgi:hypothetical protein
VRNQYRVWSVSGAGTALPGRMSHLAYRTAPPPVKNFLTAAGQGLRPAADERVVGAAGVTQ